MSRVSFDRAEIGEFDSKTFWIDLHMLIGENMARFICVEIIVLDRIHLDVTELFF